MYKKFFKRFFDILFSLSGLLILSPIIFFTTILLFFTNNGKPFFFQMRPGRGERIFRIMKFKTMNEKKDENGNLLPDAKRITKVGLFIRKSSIDELPQLVNVLRGQMSLIGPRPLLPSYLPFYTERERKRHQVRPGISGLAQIKGRNNLNWNHRLKYDVFYAEHISLSLDLFILLKSISSVFFSKGVATDPSFLMKDLSDERKSMHLQI